MAARSKDHAAGNAMPYRIYRIAAVSVSVLGADLHAQYFGQNKVRYRTFDSKVLATEHFDIHLRGRTRGCGGRGADG
jgi:hypothetical protein